MVPVCIEMRSSKMAQAGKAVNLIPILAQFYSLHMYFFWKLFVEPDAEDACAGHNDNIGRKFDILPSLFMISNLIVSMLDPVLTEAKLRSE